MSFKKIELILCCIICFAKITFAQTSGCTDYRAKNFDSKASFNDGSCIYDVTTGSPITLVEKLSDTINETSGVININGELWSFGDSGNPNAIYHFDKVTGAILQTIFIKNAINHDWEEMTCDAANIYIGDFGNNDGNRTNLTVYKIAKSQISTKEVDSITAQNIFFSYSDQVNFNSRHNANRYDCEAMFVLNDTLHLFSKDWVDGHSRHYLLSTVPGTYSLTAVDSFLSECLITGACFDKQSKRIVLVGYNKAGFCYLWLLWDFHGSNIFSGNKRKINIGYFFTVGQTEGVCFNDNNNIYITNEMITNFVDNKLYALDVGQWMNPKIAGAGINPKAQDISGLQLVPNPATEEIAIKFLLKRPGLVSYCIYSFEGKLVYCSKAKINGGLVEQKISIAALKEGTYTLIVHGDKTDSEKKIFIKK